MPSSIAPSSAAATSQMSGGSSSRDRPTTVTATSARSRLAERSSIAAMVRGVVHTRSGFAGGPGQQVRPRPRVDDVRRGDPRPTGLADPPAHVVELADVVRVRVDRQQAADRDRAPRALDGEVEPRRRAVHLERGPGPRRLGVDRVPVEVEVVALADLATRRVGDDVDVRAADRR